MFTIKEIIEVTAGRLISGDPDSRINKVSTDSRRLALGNIFIAIKGDKFDGHNFLSQAEERGAAAALISEDYCGMPGPAGLPHNITLIAVRDTLRALGALAAYHRRKFRLTVIAVTGSNGKTTTKEMIYRVISSRFNTLKSHGSFNNHIGVPLTLLEINQDHEAVVLEIGMNHKGEIAALTEIAAPDIGVITGVGPAHLEFFDGIDGIVAAKCELFETMEKGKTAVVNADFPELYERVKRYPLELITFGRSEHCRYRATGVRVKEKDTLFRLNDSYDFRLNIIGEHNVYNALAAIIVGERLGIPRDWIREGLENFSPADMRMQVLEINGIKMIADCYNANPQSVSAAIDTLCALNCTKRRGFILGDMLELGDESEHLHAEAGRKIAEAGIDFLITVGERAFYAAESARDNGMRSDVVFSVRDNGEALKIFRRQFRAGDTVLLKGSRAMKLEELIEKIRDKDGAA